jgi:hypothetical protein
LTGAGFRDDQIDVFTEGAGVDQLDPRGQSHGIWVRFGRILEDMLADAAQLFRRADETMRAGGSVLAVFTPGREEVRHRAAEILKSHGGTDTVYWGGWVTEQL